MFKKLIFLVCLSLLISCGSSHPVVRTTKNSSSQQSKPIVRNVKKPIAKPIAKTTDVKPIVTKVEPAKKYDDKQVVENNSKEQDNSIEILEATTRVKVTTAMVLDYIEKYKEIAKQDMKEFGIPASITLGQGILESGAGTGPLSVQANNHFGIKCHKEWTGPSVKYDDDTAQECFRKYSQPNDSYKDHSLFLVTRERYSSLFKLEKNDYKSWAKGLKAAGYATDSAYPTKLIALIERYELQKFDSDVLGLNYVPTKEIQVEKSIVVQKPNDVVSTNIDKDSHQVIKGDTLYSISKRYNISIEELKKKNNIADTGLSIGQKLIVR
ncbi:glucosaminidase domain-containing protein [Flavobacterium sp. SUN052]|uniref:glucosaminidase domain-containing protein n=1 Tax=Flavobacterium sp. SUN052 TaxID=3002441 RepID=UPI00237E8876|nr:glucosaminidase domain-containing protein [Flavobacterium sp. SUN052]MEC4004768.1 glucosaminidase domain-containing protein [Flavobacterium sp. SUN052]